MLLVRSALHEALSVRTKEAFPQDWAMTQNNLGATLVDQGIRIGGEHGRELIHQAIDVYELALQVRTREAFPVQWAETINNLKIAKKALEDMK